MEQNTGNKVATRVIITKTLAGESEEKQYAIGRYVDGAFTALSSVEIAKLNDTEYQNCIYDTKRYIAQAEGIESIDGIFTNEPLIYDITACPIGAESNDYSFNFTTVDRGHSWSGIGPVSNDIGLGCLYPDKPAPTKSEFIVIELNRADGMKSYAGGYTKYFTPNSIEISATSIGFYPILIRIVHVGDYVDINTPNLFNMKDSDSEYQYKVSPNIVNFIPEKPIFEINAEYKIENNKIYTRVTTHSPIKSDIEFYITRTKGVNKYFTVLANSTESEWIECIENSQSEYVAVNVDLHLVGGKKTRFDNFYRYMVKNTSWNNGVE